MYSSLFYILGTSKIVTKQRSQVHGIFCKWKDLKTSSNRNTFDNSSVILSIEGDIFPCWRIDQRISYFYTREQTSFSPTAETVCLPWSNPSTAPGLLKGIFWYDRQRGIDCLVAF